MFVRLLRCYCLVTQITQKMRCASFIATTTTTSEEVEKAEVAMQVDVSRFTGLCGCTDFHWMEASDAGTEGTDKDALQCEAPLNTSTGSEESTTRQDQQHEEEEDEFDFVSYFQSKTRVIKKERIRRRVTEILSDYIDTTRPQIVVEGGKPVTQQIHAVDSE